MGAYILRRLALMIPTLFGILLVNFLLVQFMPGGPIEQIIWNEELASEGIRIISVDPGDMDTPLHALAVPDADRSTLKRPEAAAREIADLVSRAVRGVTGPLVAPESEVVQ